MNDDDVVAEQPHPFRKLMLVLVLAAGGFAAWGLVRQQVKQKLNPLQPLYQKPYIVLYGSDDCGYCQAMRRDLDLRKIPYTYKIVADRPVQLELAPRLEQAGIDPSYFLLPLMDVNAEFLARPSSDDVIRKYGPLVAKTQ